MSRQAWAHGRNYDVSLLTSSLATPGFILGEAILGTSKLGDLGTDVPFDPTFTSITIDEPTTVEDGLFVHREVAECRLTATLPEMVELRGQYLTLKYDGKKLFAGRITRAQWTETVDVGREFLPGNTAIKTYRVSLAASNGEEVLASTAAQITGETWELADTSRVERVENLTGYPVSQLASATDIPLNTFNAGWDDSDPDPDFTFVRTSVAYVAGERRSLLDALRLEAKLGGQVVIYQPRDPDDKVILQPVNQWLTGDVEAESLYFTDEAITSPDTDPGDDFLTTDERVSFTQREVSEDPSLFTNSVVVKFSWYGGGGDIEDVEYTFGPYRATDANPQDVVVDLGLLNLNLDPGEDFDLQAYWFARAVAQTLPVKRNATPYTSSIETPLQSTRQLEGTVPGMAMLKADGVERRVAVLGRTHTITPDRWIVSYETGPEHLLSRAGDREPGPAADVSHSKVSGIDHFYWTVPDLPTDVRMYEYIFYYLAGGEWSATWQTSDQVPPDPVFYAFGIADPSGTARHRQLTIPAGYAAFVTYTSNPAPGSLNPSDVWREGQLTFLGLTG